jgi:hypothetical protein
MGSDGKSQKEFLTTLGLPEGIDRGGSASQAALPIRTESRDQHRHSTEELLERWQGFAGSLCACRRSAEIVVDRSGLVGTEAPNTTHSV